MATRPNSKVAAALQAMTVFGIPKAKVKQVLKKLLKLYYKNWQCIEEENYRALLDAIFEKGDGFEVFFSLYFYPCPLPCGCTHTLSMIFLQTYFYCWILFDRSQNHKRISHECQISKSSTSRSVGFNP